MLTTLFDGRALTATELAFAAGVTPQTTSGHLAKMMQANLVSVVKQGRHRYYRLATPQVAQMLESIMAVASMSPPRYRPRTAREDALRRARTCYDHFAGLLGVGIADVLRDKGHVILSDDGGEVTDYRNELFSKHSVLMCRSRAGDHSVGIVSTGPSGGRICRALSARRLRRDVSISTG